MTQVHSICVYCGSSTRVPDSYRATAEELGQTIGRQGIELIYGGGRIGLMGTVADAALAAGGRVVGIIPEHIKVLEVDHPELTELHVVDSMHTRKRMMFDRADAFVVLPGGLGTLDEAVEVIAWRQLGLHDKPVVLVDHKAYWRPFQTLIDHMVAVGFCRPEHTGLYRIVDDVDDVLPALARSPEPMVPLHAKWI